MVEIEIKRVREHYELFVDNVFFCSGDTAVECALEYENSKQDNNL